MTERERRLRQVTILVLFVLVFFLLGAIGFMFGKWACFLASIAVIAAVCMSVILAEAAGRPR